MGAVLWDSRCKPWGPKGRRLCPEELGLCPQGPRLRPCSPEGLAKHPAQPHTAMLQPSAVAVRSAYSSMRKMVILSVVSTAYAQAAGAGAPQPVPQMHGGACSCI